MLPNPDMQLVNSQSLVQSKDLPEQCGRLRMHGIPGSTLSNTDHMISFGGISNLIEIYPCTIIGLSGTYGEHTYQKSQCDRLNGDSFHFCLLTDQNKRQTFLGLQSIVYLLYPFRVIVLRGETLQSALANPYNH